MAPVNPPSPKSVAKLREFRVKYVKDIKLASRSSWSVLLNVSASLCLSVLSACGNGNSSERQAAKVTEVGVVTLAPQSVLLATELPGRTTPYLVAQIRPQVGGIIQKRTFVEGALVKSGALLYTIDPATYQAAYASAKASVARAEATVNAARLKARRQGELLAIEAVSQQDHEDAQVSLHQAEADLSAAVAALETATINLERTRITAPISGRVETSAITPGALVTANQETVLTSVQQLDPIYVDVPQSSAEVLQLQKALASGALKKADETSAKVQIVLEDGSLYKHDGKLLFSGITVNATTGAVTLRALVPNPDRLLLPGMYVRARLDKGVDQAALLVPQQGISRDNAGRAYALVVAQDGKVEKKDVTVAETVGTNWRVTGGLAAGDRVIVEGSSKVRAGQPVNAVPAQIGAATSGKEEKPAGKTAAATEKPAQPLTGQPASEAVSAARKTAG